MWTTRIGKVTLLCGWLTAPLAGAQPESQFFMEDPESMDAPVLRYAEPLSCPAAPEGRVWVADTEECGDAECIRKTTVWIGSWMLEDAELEVRCETDRIVLGTTDWQLVLTPDATGKLDVVEATPAGTEGTPAELAGEASLRPASET